MSILGATRRFIGLYAILSNTHIMSELSDNDINSLLECRLCPRQCGANRTVETGMCGAGENVEISSVNLHFGEEPPISGNRGSGTIFLTHCSLKCVYCQNYPISQQGIGKEYSIGKIVDSMLYLQRRGAHNINLVTPSHYVLQLRTAILLARENGLNIPIVYNTSGYDLPEAIEAMNGIVDIYMPDMRYWESKYAKMFSNAADYPDVTKEAIKLMYSQVGNLKMDNDGVAMRGLLIRLLVLPENISGTVKTLEWIAQNIGTKTYLSVMSQYFPANRSKEFPSLDRRIDANEYIRVLEAIDKLGFARGYVQPVPQE